MKKVLLFFIFAIANMYVFAQTVNWVGATSSAYFTASNWNPATTPSALAQTEIMMIGNGSPNNCVHSGGSTANAYRPGRLNVLTGASFTINGTLYPWASDSINGNVTINSPGDFSIRNIAYIGRNTSGTIINVMSARKIGNNNVFNIAVGNSGSSATINLLGGTLNVGTTLNIANGTGLTAYLNIDGGAANVPTGLNIGTGGHIFIGGVGYLRITGNKVTQLTGLVSDGRLTCTPGRSLDISFDGTYTYARILQNPNSMITEYPDSVVLKTTNIVCSIEKRSGNILSYRFKGKETVANKSTDAHKYMYHDFTTSYGFETIFGATYEVVQDSTDFAHIVIKRPYTPAAGHVTPVDCELHYSLKKNDNGIYVYSKLEHKPNYPAFDIGSWRQVWWIASNNGINLTERIYTDSLRSWQMNAPNDTYEATGIAEIIKQTSGVRAGKFDGKYEYSMKFWDNPVWGHASNVNNIGIWCLNTSCEYYNEGPMYHDLNAAAGIIHQCMNGVHYGAGGIMADTLTSWSKVYGPYMLLITDKSTGDSNWAAAKQRQVEEKALWPYSWVKDTTAYPLTNQRGSITGKFLVSDPLKPTYNGSGAWVGVTDLSDGANGFQFESKNYQYWIKSDAAGNFNLANVRPGTYSLFAFVDGAVGEYRMDNVTVTAGGVNNLGTLVRTIDRTVGNLAWEIGVPNRMANEYKLGDFDYCEGFVERKFRDTFPNPIEYNVADNNWGTKLNYAHTKYPTESFAPGDAWKWRINFVLPAGTPTTGNARLTIAYAAADHAQQWIYVNNENTLFNSYYPDFGDGNMFIRQSNFGKYSYKQISIPMNRLVVGNNTITLVMPSNSLWVSHLMYDYLSLELPSSALPITMLSFDAKATLDKKVQLNWNTANEVNNHHFEVERSVDGKHFTSIGTVLAAPVTSSSNTYNFVDAQHVNGTSYYRLKQVDVNGKFAYSQIKQVCFQDKSFISIYPNPVSAVLYVQSSAQTPLKQVSISDAQGKVVLQAANINANQVKLDIQTLAKGIYFVKVNDGVNETVQKIMKD